MQRQTYGYLPSLGASPPFDQYQIILLGDRGTCVWTTCLRSLPGSVLVRSQTCAPEWPHDYKSGTLPLDYRASSNSGRSRILSGSDGTVRKCLLADLGRCRLVVEKILIYSKLLGVLERRECSRSATEHRPAGNRCGRVQMNMDIVGSRRNGPQLSTHHDDDDDVVVAVNRIQANYKKQ